MLKHIRKELIFNKTNLYIFAGYILVFWVWIILQDFSPRFSLVLFSFVLPLFCASSFPAREEKFKAWTLNCSLPTNRNTIILARLITSWSLMIAALIFGILISAAFQKNHAIFHLIIQLKYIFIFFLFSSLFLAFLFPFVIRFGISGVMIGLVLLQFLGIITLVLTRAAGSKDNIFRSMIHSVINAIKFLLNQPSTITYLLGLIISVAVINAVTLKSSQFLFARRDF
ncbi:MAG: hypothetical protein GF421_05280 [Candidatus Aminicenantes bacterium]|nr:hypothetical protein [Candidatus Aminicenantes bacterium]